MKCQLRWISVLMTSAADSTHEKLLYNKFQKETELLKIYYYYSIKL